MMNEETTTKEATMRSDVYRVRYQFEGCAAKSRTLANWQDASIACRDLYDCGASVFGATWIFAGGTRELSVADGALAPNESDR